MGLKIDRNFKTLVFWLIPVAAVLLAVRLFLRRTVRTAKLKRWWRLVSDRFHEHQLLKVPQFDDSHRENYLYRRLSLYLNSLESLEDSHLTNLFAEAAKPTAIALSLNPNQSLDDEFLGARLRWTHQVEDGGERRAFVVRVRKRDKRRILRPYLQHIHAVSEEIAQSESKEVRLFINAGGGGGEGGRVWRSAPFTHPATIETIAMEADVKSKVKADLEAFLRSKQYYHRLGRAWRRSYLLYGPSGTGKSSFAAAIAKFLGYDIYDVDLSSVSGDSDLKFLLLNTTNRSVILVEDFDRYIAGAGERVSISGVLNFMDGMVSSCCDERVMVFISTTKDAIDPALLRPGRVDVHIHFPMCNFSNFKSLASSYLGVREHKLFPAVEEMFQSGATLSPAEIGELMMVNRSSPSRALKSVITALQTTGGDRWDPKRSGSRRGEAAAAAEAGRESVDSAVVSCKDGVKEFRKLYELLRGRSTKRSEPFDLNT